MRKSLIFGVFSSLLLSACASDGNISNIFWRKLTWESYVSGGDIKKACMEEGSVNQYRYLYNANRADRVLSFNWNDKVQSVEIDDIARGVDAGIKLNGLGELWDLFNPTHHSVDLQNSAEIEQAVAHDLALKSVSTGARFSSAQHFTVLAACEDGQFKLSLFTQEAMQETYPAGLTLMKRASEGVVDFPILPADKAVEGLVPLVKQGNEESFIHYLITKEADRLVFGQSYPFKK